jgi:cytochrome b6-f complex iron-sulfur subunit
MEATSKTMNRQAFFRLLGVGFSAITVANSLSACESHAEDLAPNSDALDMTIQLDDARYANLQKAGGYTSVENRVIVAHIQANQYVALALKCTHEGTSLVYRADNNLFYCPLDQSRYDITGKVLAGPATQPLARYNVSNDQKSNSIRIFS